LGDNRPAEKFRAKWGVFWRRFAVVLLGSYQKKAKKTTEKRGGSWYLAKPSLKEFF